MQLKEITLLSKEDYLKYRSFIRDASCSWWLKTPYRNIGNRFWCVNSKGETYIGSSTDCIGVRPLCIFGADFTDSVYWSKLQSLMGHNIKFGNFEWTILGIKEGEIYALCNEIIERCYFDSAFTNWEYSELKAWLEAEGLKLVNA